MGRTVRSKTLSLTTKLRSTYVWSNSIYLTMYNNHSSLPTYFFFLKIFGAQGTAPSSLDSFTQLVIVSSNFYARFLYFSRRIRFFVSDLFQKRPSWRGRAGAGPYVFQKKEK